MAMTWSIVSVPPPHYDNTDDGKAVFGTPINTQIAEISELYNKEPNTSPKTLCEICTTFRLKRSDFLLPQFSSTKPQLVIGRFVDAGFRDCSLCELVIKALRKEKRLHDRIEELKGDVEVFLQWTTDGGWVEYRDRPNLPALGIGVRFMDGPEQCSHKIQLFSEPRTPELFLGRIYPYKKVNLGLVLKWLKFCRENHHGECSSSFRSNLPHPATKITFYGIDVERMALTELDEQAVYCTLSYTWGSTKQFRTTKAKLSDLSQPGGLSEVWDDIPATVQDAIGIVKDLGLKYLWVDAICLVQDDDETKMDAISKMHLVYGKSYLTVVAGTGDNSNHGLPGYRDGSRGHSQAVAILGDEKFTIGLIPKYQEVFFEAPYSQRGWTYQEFCFSVHSLVFLDGQVFFQCQQAVWREDYVVEHDAVRYQFQELQGRISDKGTHPWEGPISSILQQYKLILEEYTRRNLSYGSDILKAYMGLSEFWSASVPFLDESWQGMHASLIDWLVLWRSSPSSTRRAEFPSWSWAGWTGEAMLPSLMPTPYNTWATHHACSEFAYFGKDFIETGTGALRCISTTAFFTLCKPITGEDFLNPLYPLIDRRGVLCGLLQIHEWEYFWKDFNGDTVKLVVLSDMLPSQGQFLEAGEFEYDSETNPEELIPWSVSTCTGHEGEMWQDTSHRLSFYNVLLVARRGFIKALDKGCLTTFGVYEKAGGGVISNASLKWASDSAPQQETIFLI